MRVLVVQMAFDRNTKSRPNLAQSLTVYENTRHMRAGGDSYRQSARALLAHSHEKGRTVSLMTCRCLG